MVAENQENVLELSNNYSLEELRHNYHMKYIQLYRERLHCVTLGDCDQYDSEIENLNKAHASLTNNTLKNSLNLQLAFDDINFPEIPDPAVYSSEDYKLKEVVQDYWGNHQHGLVLSLLEICINKALRSERGKQRIHYAPSLKLLGKTMLEIGMIEQGVQYASFGMGSFEKAQVYKSVGDYKQAAHFFGLSLKNKDAGVPIDEICQQISMCYFMLNDFENALSIIEDILPELIPRKEIFEVACKSKRFATVLILSISRLHDISDSMLQSTRIRIKYPLSYKYLRNCYGTMTNAYKVIKNMEENSDRFDEFIDSLQHKYEYKKKVELEYDLENLSAAYFKVFDEPLEKSKLYYKK